MTEYVGRFAPSPTGPLHFGSLVAAVASYLQACVNNGEWLVRIEDIDPPREPPEAQQQILKSLRVHGFEFNEPILQSQRLPAYDAAIDQLTAAGLAYPCSCTRRDIRATAEQGLNGPVYPGTCRHGLPAGVARARAIRFRTDNSPIAFHDGLQGPQVCKLESESGDFLLRRGDGLVSYQLAVALDDADQGITEVVRGTDLLNSTFCQIALLGALNKPGPAYMHVPIVVNAQGQKLSKQHGTPALNLENTSENIYNSLFFLYQDPPKALRNGSLAELWNWAVTNWDPKKLAGQRSRPESVIIIGI